MSGSAGAEADDYNDWYEQQQRGGAIPAGPSPFDALQDTPAPAPAYGIPTRSSSGGGGYVPRTAHGADVMAGLRARQEQQTARPALDPDAQPVAVGAPPTPKEQGSLKDFGDQVWSSTLDMGEAAVSAASFAARQLGASPETVQYLEQQKAAVGKHIEATLQGMSPGAQKALHASIFNDGSPDAPTWGQAGYFRTAGATLASLVPQVALAVLPGGVAGKIATKIAGSVAGGVARTAATAGAFGTVDAGSAYKTMIDEVDSASEKELMDSPVYRELRGGGMSDIAARKQLIQAVAPTMVAGHFAAGAAAGSGAGGLLTKGAMGAAGRGALGRAGIGAAEGAAVMGGQAAADNALDQGAQQQLGGRVNFDPAETAKAFAAGALGGAVLGAGAGVLHAKPTPKGMAPDIAAALAEALPETPKPQAPSFDATGQGTMFPAQTEMFPGPGEMGQAPPPGPARPDVRPGTDPAAQQAELFDPANAPRPPTPVATQGAMDLQGSYAPGAPGVAGFHPPADPNAGMAQAAQPELAMRAPPPVADPRMPDAGQGELFRQPGAPTDQAPQAPQAAPAPVAPPAPAPAPAAEPGLLSRRQLIEALTQAGQDPQLLAHARLGDLRAMHDAIGQRVLRPEAVAAQPEQPTETQQPGHETPTVVETEPALQTADPGVASSPEPPPPDSVSATPSAETVGPAPLSSIAGYDRNPDDPLRGRIDYLNERLQDPALPDVTRNELSLRAKMFANFIGNRDDAAKAQSPGLAAAIRRLKIGDTITGTTKEFGAVTGRIAGFDLIHVGIDDADGIHHGVHIGDITAAGDAEAKPAAAPPIEAQAAAPAPEVQAAPTRAPEPTPAPAPEPAPVESKPAPTPKLTKDQELRAAAAAKRAAAKAAMARPGERVKGEGAVAAETEAEPPVETPAPAKPAAPARDLAAVLGDIRVAATRAANMNELPPAIRDKFVADITKLVASATSEADAHAKIAAFGEAGRDHKFPGSRVSRAVVADRVLQLLRNGKGLDSAEAFRRETVRQGRGASVRESEGVASKADIEDKMAGTEITRDEASALRERERADDSHAIGETPTVGETAEADSGGITTDYEVGEKTRAAATTDLARKGDDLVHKLLQGTMDPETAHAAFGEKLGGPGRPPRWKTLAHFIEDRIATAPKREADLVASLSKLERDRILTPAERGRETRRITKELAETDPEHLDRLRDLAEQLRDPVGHAARNAGDQEPLYRLATPSPEFRRWFGASKVVDAEGKPLVVYHGTPSGNIEAFNSELRGTGTGAPSAKLGFFFTNRPRTADYYAGGARAMENAGRAASEDAMQRRIWQYDPDKLQEVERRASTRAGPNVVPVYLSLENPLVYDFKGRGFRDESYRDLIQRAIDEGKDGIILRRTFDAGEHGLIDRVMQGRFRPEDIYVALKPEQIKSAIGNSGAFDPNNPSILHRAGTEGIHPTSSRYVRAANDPALNRFLPERIRAVEAGGGNFTLHQALDTIVGHTGVRAELRPLHALALRLRQITEDIPVMTPEGAVRRGYLDAEQAEDFNTRVRGAHYPGLPDGELGPGQPHIVINNGFSGHVETLLHEAMHAVTQRYFDRLMETSPNHPDLQAFHAIARELALQMHQARFDTRADEARAVWQRAMGGSLDPRAQVHELHTALMTSPELQSWAASREASAGLRHDMAELGYARYGHDGQGEWEPTASRPSIWRFFTDVIRRVLGLKPAASVSEYTLLDHVMRMTQDITDRATEYNRRLLPNDPVLRAQAEPLYRMAAGSFGKAKEDTLRAVDPSRIGDSLRRGVLQGATTDAIHNWNHTLFEPSDRLAIGPNPLTRFRAASEAISRRAADFHAQFIDRVRGLAGQLKGRDALNKLMTDATLAEAHLAPTDPAKANLHLTTPEQRADLAALQARFAALSPEDQATYKATRDHYAETYRQTRDAELKSLVSNALPDATPAQIAALTKATRSKTTLDKFIKSGTDADLVAAFGKAWEDNRALVKGIAEVHAKGFVQGDYFPLRRYGDYLIRYGVEGEKGYGVERFEKRSEADARYAELAQADTEDLSQVQTMGTSYLKTPSVDAPLVGELTHALRAKGADADHVAAVADSLNRILLEHATHSERARMAMRRKGVAGASVDQARTLAREFLSTGSRIGHLEHGGARYKALSDMRLVSKDLARMGQRGEQIRAQAVTHELEQRVAVLEDQGGVLAAITRKAGTFGFIQSLMSPSHMITSSIEAHMNSTALLGARHGAGRATLALSKALADVAPKLLKTGAANTLKAIGQGLKQADWDLSKVARDRLIAGGANAKAMTDLFARLDAAGLIDHTADAEMRRIANPSGVVSKPLGKYWQRFMDMNAAGAHAVDVANKAAIAKAAYDLELRKTGNHATAADYAVEAVRQTTPNYNLANKARITTAKGALGTFAGPITQFKQYGIHMYGVMANLAKASVHGADREARVEARKAFAGILATHALMAGGLTLIADPLRYIGGAYDAIFGPTGGKPHDYQNDVRGFLSDTFGPELGEVMARGLPHLAGIDIHRRVGLANLLEIPELKSFDKKGMAEMLASAVMGAAGDDAERLGLGALKLLKGDPSGIMDMVPRVVRDMGKAAKLADRGVTDSKGKTILPASALSTADIARQAVGFQPSRVSEFHEGRFAVQERASETKDAKTRLMDAWVGALPADRAPVMAQIRAFNQDNRGQAITTDALLRKLAADRKQASQRPDNFGLRLPPKAAQSLRQAGRFAYQQ